MRQFFIGYFYKFGDKNLSIISANLDSFVLEWEGKGFPSKNTLEIYAVQDLKSKRTILDLDDCIILSVYEFKTKEDFEDFKKIP